MIASKFIKILRCGLRVTKCQRWHQETHKWDLHEDGNSNDGKFDLKLLTSQVLELGKYRLDSYINRNLAAHVLTIWMDKMQWKRTACISIWHVPETEWGRMEGVELDLYGLEKVTAKVIDLSF